MLEWAGKLGHDVSPDSVNLAKLTLKISHDDGTYCLIELLGAHDLAQVELLRGTQYDLVIVDEAQLIRPSVLEAFLKEVIVPGCRARNGAIMLIGTPGPVRFGPFFDLWHNERWSKFKWTAFDNPTTPPGSIEQEILDLGLKTTDARYVREYLGEWYDGYDDSKVWDFDPIRNALDIELPVSAAKAGPLWRFSWGIDLASVTDNDALVVLGWRTTDGEQRLYVVDSWQRPGSEDVDELGELLKQKREQWHPSAVVGDSGGHGAQKILNTYQARLQLHFQSKPTSVEATVRMANNDLRMSRLRMDPQGELAQDMRMETWEVSKTGRRVIGGDYHSDLTAAFRYAHTAARAFRAEAPPVRPVDPDERRALEIRQQLDNWERQRKRGKWS